MKPARVRNLRVVWRGMELDDAEHLYILAHGDPDGRAKKIGIKHAKEAGLTDEEIASLYGHSASLEALRRPCAERGPLNRNGPRSGSR
jgi:hypothetical protein